MGDYAGILRNQTGYHQDGGPPTRREAKEVSGIAKKTQSVKEDNRETVGVINRPTELRKLSNNPRKTILTQNVFSDSRDEEVSTVFHTEANQRGAVGHENMGDISARF